MAVVISDRLLERSDRLLDAEPDEQLVGLVQSGHEAAFAAIVRRYERELQAQARRLTSDGRAEDAVQQAFLNAFTALQRGGEVRHLRGWLHQILRHEVARARVPVDVPLEAATAYGEPLEDTVQRRATAHQTLAQLSALPDRQRDALLGTAVLGFPRAQVARTMGLSEGAVRQLVHRARLRLRQAATALIPFPLVKLFGAARSGVDAAPDAALGAGTAASGGLVIKVGALLASGVVATGIAVTHTFPSGHHAIAPARGARHHIVHAREAAHVVPASSASVAPSDPAFVTSSLRLREHGPAGLREDGRSHGGPGGLSGTRAGRRGGPGSGRGRGDGRGNGGSGSAGRGDDGSGGSPGGTSGRGSDGGGSSSRSGSSSGSGSGSRSGSGSSDGGDGSGSGRSGSGSGSGHQTGSGSATGTAGSGSGSGSGNGGGSSDTGLGSGRSGGAGGSGSSADDDASTAPATGTSGSASATAATVTGDETSGDGGESSSEGGSSGGGSSDSGGSDNGGQENSSGSRDVSGSLASSSS
ncbi:MAG TPA: RNA polymerase sigma factor [Solirubrobacteraceae bacterium]|jgi:RNA polymerase sigma factor (sigma-70 family)|nr:RNA polymerase sigma factor [Solirubrobacteraceae bacterium]